MAGGVFAGSVPIVEIIHGLPPAPTCSIAPIDPSVTEGDVIAFVATATAYKDVLTYQWFVNAVAIVGATAAAYNHTALLAENGQAVTCNVADGYGQAAASAASVMTIAPAAWTPAKLFENGELGGWYEIRPGAVWKDTAMTQPAVEGDNIMAVSDLSGNGEHLKKVATFVVPTLQRDANGYFMGYPNAAPQIHAEFEWKSAIIEVEYHERVVAVFFSQGASSGGSFSQTIFNQRHSSQDLTNTLSSISYTMKASTNTAYEIISKTGGANMPNHPVAITATALDSYMSDMRFEGDFDMRIDHHKDGAAGAFQTGAQHRGASSGLIRNKVIGSFGLGVKLRAMLDLVDAVISDADWAELDAYWKAMPK